MKTKLATKSGTGNAIAKKTSVGKKANYIPEPKNSIALLQKLTEETKHAKKVISVQYSVIELLESRIKNLNSQIEFKDIEIAFFKHKAGIKLLESLQAETAREKLTGIPGSKIYLDTEILLKCRRRFSAKELLPNKIISIEGKEFKVCPAVHFASLINSIN